MITDFKHIDERQTSIKGKYTLTYILLCSQKNSNSNQDDGIFYDEYSIKVVMEDTVTGEHDEETAYSITVNEDFARKIFSMLYKGKVTPLTFFDVISDIIE